MQVNAGGSALSVRVFSPHIETQLPGREHVLPGAASISRTEIRTAQQNQHHSKVL